MKCSSRVLGIIVLVLGLLAISNGMKAQDVVRQGNTFVEQQSDSTQRGGKYTKTEYLYTDKKGNTDTVYVSSRGSAFIWKVSKTGRVYRKYLPKVTEALGLKKDESDENK